MDLDYSFEIDEIFQLGSLEEIIERSIDMDGGSNFNQEVNSTDQGLDRHLQEDQGQSQELLSRSPPLPPSPPLVINREFIITPRDLEKNQELFARMKELPGNFLRRKLLPPKEECLPDPKTIKNILKDLSDMAEQVETIPIEIFDCKAGRLAHTHFLFALQSMVKGFFRFKRMEETMELYIILDQLRNNQPMSARALKDLICKEIDKKIRLAKKHTYFLSFVRLYLSDFITSWPASTNKKKRRKALSNYHKLFVI